MLEQSKLTEFIWATIFFVTFFVNSKQQYVIKQRKVWLQEWRN